MLQEHGPCYEALSTAQIEPEEFCKFLFARVPSQNFSNYAINIHGSTVNSFSF